MRSDHAHRVHGYNQQYRFEVPQGASFEGYSVEGYSVQISEDRDKQQPFEMLDQDLH
jgi:hypothetical protein